MTPTVTPQDVAGLLVVSSLPSPSSAVAGLFLADDAGPNGKSSEGPKFRVTSFEDWPASCGLPPELPFLAFTLAEGGQPMEVVLAGMEAGRGLKEGGITMLLGPSLEPAAWSCESGLATRTAVSLCEGLAASGVLVCVDGFPAAPESAIGGPLSTFGAAFTNGVEAVRLGLQGSSESLSSQASLACSTLREGLGFEGLIVCDAEAENAACLIEAGCDLLIAQHEPSQVEAALHTAVMNGTLSATRILEARRSIAEIVQSWL